MKTSIEACYVCNGTGIAPYYLPKQACYKCSGSGTYNFNLKIYYEMLENFDWFYAMSDDHSVWKSGESHFSYLRKLAEKYGGRYKELYTEYTRYIGSLMTSKKLHKPERPE